MEKMRVSSEESTRKMSLMLFLLADTMLALGIGVRTLGRRDRDARELDGSSEASPLAKVDSLFRPTPLDFTSVIVSLSRARRLGLDSSSIA
jgi:hypothetical protein